MQKTRVKWLSHNYKTMLIGAIAIAMLNCFIAFIIRQTILLNQSLYQEVDLAYFILLLLWQIIITITVAVNYRFLVKTGRTNHKMVKILVPLSVNILGMLFISISLCQSIIMYL